MTEPKRWTPSEVYHHAVNSDRFVVAADFDRLRTERDAACWTCECGADEACAFVRQRDEARRVAGVLADALRGLRGTNLLTTAELNRVATALAVFDTLTED